MTRPVYEANATGSKTTSASDTVTITPLENDILIYQLYFETAEGAAAVVVTYNTDVWTEIEKLDQDGPMNFDGNLVIAWQRVDATPPTSFSFSFDSSNYHESAIHRISGCITSGNPYDAEAGELSVAGSDDTAPCPTVNAADGDRLGLRLVMSLDGGNSVWVAPNGAHTERLDSVSIAAYSFDQETGASGAVEIGDAGTNAIWPVGYTILMTPAVAPVAGQPAMIRTQGIPTGPGSRDRPGKWNFSGKMWVPELGLWVARQAPRKLVRA